MRELKREAQATPRPGATIGLWVVPLMVVMLAGVVAPAVITWQLVSAGIRDGAAGPLIGGGLLVALQLLFVRGMIRKTLSERAAAAAAR